MFDPDPEKFLSVSGSSVARDPIAEKTYQVLIDAISTHFWNRDWDLLEFFMDMPNTVSADGKTRVFHSYAEFLPVLRESRANFDTLGVSEYHRLCRSARFEDAARTRIVGTHETFVLRGSAPVITPYTASIQAVWAGDRWCSRGLISNKREADLPTLYPDIRGVAGR